MIRCAEKMLEPEDVKECCVVLSCEYVIWLLSLSSHSNCGQQPRSSQTTFQHGWGLTHEALSLCQEELMTSGGVKVIFFLQLCSHC